MKNQLILMRHGKSDWSEPLSDFKRPIKQRGIKESSRIGAWIKEQELAPDLLVSSPAQRARETSETSAFTMGYRIEDIFWNESVYMADVSELLDVIATTPEECKRLMLVGHNPGLEDLLFYLTREFDIPDDGKVMPTATVAVLETDMGWSDLEHASCDLAVIVRGRYL